MLDVAGADRAGAGPGAGPARGVRAGLRGRAGQARRRCPAATAGWRCSRTCASTPARRRTTPPSPTSSRRLGDVYVNDAFSASHRAHASITGLAERLPAYAGRLMQAELEALEGALGGAQRPTAALIGGAKVSSKLAVLGHVLDRVDVLVIGGGMANTFLNAKGVNVGKSLCERDLADTAREIMAKAEPRTSAIVLPEDGVVATKFEEGAAARTVPIGQVGDADMILDVGPRPSRPSAASWSAARRCSGTVPRAPSRSALRRGHQRRGAQGGRADQGRQAAERGRRRRHGGGAGARRRARGLHLRLDGGRRVPRMAGRQGAAGGGGPPPSLGPPLAVVFHDLAQARACLEAAARLGLAVELVSADHVAAFAGVGFLRGVEERLGRSVIADCGDDAGLVMAALRAGLRDLLFTGDERLRPALSEMAEAAGRAVAGGAGRASAGAGAGRGPGEAARRVDRRSGSIYIIRSRLIYGTCPWLSSSRIRRSITSRANSRLSSTAPLPRPSAVP